MNVTDKNEYAKLKDDVKDLEDKLDLIGDYLEILYDKDEITR